MFTSGWRLISIIGAVIVITPSTVVGQTGCDEIQKDFFVEIIPDGKTRIGSGVVLTRDGFIITALHVVEGYLEVGLRIEGSKEIQHADVIDAEPFYDIALLKITGDQMEYTPARLAIESNNSLTSMSTLCLGGYGNGRENDQVTPRYDPFRFVQLNLREKDRGYIRVEGSLQTGYSGGGAFSDGRLYGVNLQRDKFGTQVLPIERTISFLARNGLETIGGKVTTTPGFSGLLSFIRSNREFINQILTSVNWEAQFPYMEGERDNKDLNIWFERNFPAQNVTGFFSGNAVPIFRGRKFSEWMDDGNSPLSYPVNGAVDEGRIVISDFVSALQSLKIKYEQDHQLNVDISKIDTVRIEGDFYYSQFAEKIGPIVIELSGQR